MAKLMILLVVPSALCLSAAQGNFFSNIFGNHKTTEAAVGSTETSVGSTATSGGGVNNGPVIPPTTIPPASFWGGLEGTMEEEFKKLFHSSGESAATTGSGATDGSVIPSMTKTPSLSNKIKDRVQESEDELKKLIPSFQFPPLSGLSDGSAGSKGNNFVNGTDILGTVAEDAETAIANHFKMDKKVIDTAVKTFGDITHSMNGTDNGDIKNLVSAATRNINNMIHGVINKSVGGTEDTIREIAVDEISSMVNKAVEDCITKFGGLGILGSLAHNGDFSGIISSFITKAATKELDNIFAGFHEFNAQSVGSEIGSEVMKIIDGFIKGAVQGAILGGVVGGIDSSKLGVAPKVDISFGGKDVPIAGNTA